MSIEPTHLIAFDPTAVVDEMYRRFPGLSSALTPEFVIRYALSQAPGEFWLDNHSEVAVVPLRHLPRISFSRYDFAELNGYSQEYIDDYVTVVLDTLSERLNHSLNIGNMRCVYETPIDADRLKLVSWQTMPAMMLTAYADIGE